MENEFEYQNTLKHAQIKSALGLRLNMDEHVALIRDRERRQEWFPVTDDMIEEVL